MKKFYPLVLIFALIFSCATDNQVQEELLPEKIEYSSVNKITIRCQKEDCGIFLNGEYQGLSPVTISDLVPGTYYLQVKKSEYKDLDFFIQVKKDQSLYYYVDNFIDASTFF